MELVQNGESSRSPSRHIIGDGPESAMHEDSSRTGAGPGPSNRKSRLIMPTWDVAPRKHVHASHDLIAALSLRPQYETYLKAYAQPVTEDDQMAANAGQRRKPDGRRLERGYAGLLDGIMDPTPLGSEAHQRGSRDILPLISDYHNPADGLGRVAPDVWEGPIEMLGRETFRVATLETGQAQPGYKDGQKISVIEAHERRERKKQRQMRLQSQTNIASPLASPTLAPNASSPITTPLLPVAPPSRSAPQGTFASMQAQAQAQNQAQMRGNGLGKGGSGTIRLVVPGGTVRSPAPASSPLAGTNNKRPYPEASQAGKPKKAKTAGTRSASPMPTRTQIQHERSHVPPGGQAKPYGKGPRARTEG